MKRDMALVQRVLEHIEGGNRWSDNEPPVMEGHSPTDVAGHLELCNDAGFVWRAGGSVINLTWSGHDALADLRAGNPVKVWPAHAR